MRAKTRKFRFFTCLLVLGMVVSSAWAKMVPLKETKDQFIQPNILVILDTSGSMQSDINGNTLSTPDSEGRTYGDHEESRLNIAKEVITDALNESRKSANFGLMSFKQTYFGFNSNQKGYFPYYKPSKKSSITETVYFSRHQLDEAIYTVNSVPNQRANSGSPNFSPVNSFVFHGVTYTLKSSYNSKYQRWSSDLEADIYADHNYCGYTAEFQDPNDFYAFTWTYQGSYYEYTKYDLIDELDHEIEYYNNMTGELVAWVKVPVLKHNEDTVIYLYYGNSSISSPTENPTEVWNQNIYKGTWHLHDDFLDSTSNDNDGINSGSVDINGKIGRAQSFDGINDYIDVGSKPSIDNIFIHGGTISTWFYLTDWGLKETGRIINKNENNDGWELFIEQSTQTIKFGRQFSTTDGIWTGPNMSLNTWTHVAVIYNADSTSNDPIMYINGTLQTMTESQTPEGIAISDEVSSAGIANRQGNDRTFSGIIDEPHIVDDIRSPDWIMTEYTNQNSPSTFYTISEGLSGDGNFSRCKKITIDHSKVSGNSDLYDFPVLIHIVDNELTTTTYVKNSNGYDIIFKESEDFYYFDQFYGPQFIADGTEDENGGASRSVDPNDLFIYYPGKDRLDFKYSTSAGWSDPNFPVGALDEYNSARGGMLLVPIAFSADQAVQDAKVNEILRWMAPQNSGGLIATGYTPTGSILKNTNPDPNYYDDAYSYFDNEILPNDPVSCRKNFIIFVTDGDPSPSEEGATAINAASTLYNTKNVTVYMIGFGSNTTGSATLDDIASAGGSPLKSDGHYAYFAGDGEALEKAIKNIIFEAETVDYVTSAPASDLSSKGRRQGHIGLIASCEFPDWKGHLVASNLVTGTQLWDAGEQLDANHISYNARKIYTSDLSTGDLVPFFISGNPNDSALHNLGLGASVAEAADIIEFISGKGRFWRLSDITNCTPIVVGPPNPPDDPTSAPDHDLFEALHKQRKRVVYCGSNDCMLHCFDMDDGHEIFAYVPPDLLPKLSRIFLNRNHPTTPDDHIYGVAASPKVSDIFHDGAWKTVLICGEGPGGYHYFALDVTHPSPGDYNYNANAPFSVFWHTGDANHKTIYDPLLGESWSTPALGKITYDNLGTPVTKYAAFVGSGYDDPNSTDAEGTTFMAIKFDSGSENGKLLYSVNVGSASTIVDHGLVTDAVCYNNNGVTTDTYITDTAGRIWHTDTVGSPLGWTMDLIYDASVDQPFFYSPAVLQMGSGASACTLLVAASGTYDDPGINQSGSTFSTKIYLLLFDSSHFLYHSEVINLTDLLIEPLMSNFPQRSRITSSPVIIKNDLTSQYEAVFLTYVPPAVIGCDPGKTYLVVYKLGLYENFNLSQHAFIKSLEAGAGKVTGINVVGKTSIVVSVSKHGKGQLATLESLPSPPIFSPGIIQQLYWKDYF